MYPGIDKAALVEGLQAKLIEIILDKLYSDLRARIDATRPLMHTLCYRQFDALFATAQEPTPMLLESIDSEAIYAVLEMALADDLLGHTDNISAQRLLAQWKIVEDIWPPKPIVLHRDNDFGKSFELDASPPHSVADFCSTQEVTKDAMTTTKTDCSSELPLNTEVFMTQTDPDPPKGHTSMIKYDNCLELPNFEPLALPDFAPSCLNSNDVRDHISNTITEQAEDHCVKASDEQQTCSLNSNKSFAHGSFDELEKPLDDEDNPDFESSSSTLAVCDAAIEPTSESSDKPVASDIQNHGATQRALSQDSFGTQGIPPGNVTLPSQCESSGSLTSIGTNSVRSGLPLLDMVQDKLDKNEDMCCPSITLTPADNGSNRYSSNPFSMCLAEDTSWDLPAGWRRREDDFNIAYYPRTVCRSSENKTRSRRDAFSTGSSQQLTPALRDAILGNVLDYRGLLNSEEITESDKLATAETPIYTKTCPTVHFSKYMNKCNTVIKSLPTMIWAASDDPEQEISLSMWKDFFRTSIGGGVCEEVEIESTKRPPGKILARASVVEGCAVLTMSGPKLLRNKGCQVQDCLARPAAALEIQQPQWPRKPRTARKSQASPNSEDSPQPRERSKSQVQPVSWKAKRRRYSQLLWDELSCPNPFLPLHEVSSTDVSPNDADISEEESALSMDSSVSTSKSQTRPLDTLKQDSLDDLKSKDSWVQKFLRRPNATLDQYIPDDTASRQASEIDREVISSFNNLLVDTITYWTDLDRA